MKRSLFTLAILAICLTPLPAQERETLPTPRGIVIGSLADKLTTLAKAHKGKVCIAMRHLETKEEFFFNEKETMQTASLIKLPILVEAYYQKQEKRIDFDKTITLTKEDMVPGSGVLTEHFSPGMTMKLRDALRLMIAFSDNTATNLVLDQISLPATNIRMEKLGFPETRINAKVFKASYTAIDPERTRKYQLGSTQAKDMIDLLQMIHEHKILTQEACEEIKTHLFKCDAKETFPRELPPIVRIAHKTGATNRVRTDAGILYFPGGPVALCVLTGENEDERWTSENAGEVLCAKVAKEVYERFKGKK